MKIQKTIVYAFGLLLSCFISEVAYSQQINCGNHQQGIGCGIGITVNNYYNYIPQNQIVNTPTSSSKPSNEVFQVQYEKKPVPQEPLISPEREPTPPPNWSNNPAFIVK